MGIQMKFTHADLIAQGYVFNDSTRSYEKPGNVFAVRIHEPGSELHKTLGLVEPNPAKSTAFDQSPLEARFLALWEQAGGPPLLSEVRLIPDRKFRCDFLHEPTKSVFEIQGFKDHTSAKGFKRDNEKHLLLFLNGYQVVTLDRAQITLKNIELIADKINLTSSRNAV